MVVCARARACVCIRVYVSVYGEGQCEGEKHEEKVVRWRVV